jgi:hypothetical protein
MEVRDMHTKFKIGDRVRWNSEAGRASGRIVKVHTKNVDYKGYTHHASAEEPQYEIRSDRTDHTAMHKGTALHKISRPARRATSALQRYRCSS